MTWAVVIQQYLSTHSFECYESRAITLGSDGKSIDEDFARTHEIWTRFAKSSERS